MNQNIFTIFAIFIKIVFGQFIPTCQNADNKQLIMTHLIWRHGDRAPGSTYPTDQYQESAWPQGWDQLTQIGMTQTYNLGLMIRQRYIQEFQLVPAKYMRVLSYMRSTDVDRAIQSGQCVQAALFPPTGDQVWNPAIPWQPVPIHVKIPTQQDILLKVSTACKAECPAYKKLKDTMDDQLDANFAATHVALRQTLLQYSGYDDGLTLGDLDTITGTSDKERIHNMSQPAWLDQPYPQANSPQTLYEYASQVNLIYKLMGDQNLMIAKFEGGYLLNDITQRMVRAMDQYNATGQIFGTDDDGGDVPPDRTLMLYSSHDGTLTSLLINMFIPQNMRIPYATCLFFDLFYDCTMNDYYVQLSWSLDQKTITPLRLACSKTNGSNPSNNGSLSTDWACTMNDFLRTFNDRLYTMDQWQTDCNA